MADRPPKSVHTIPASPGFTLWWTEDNIPVKGETIVGWLIEELERNDGSTLYWQLPITPGDVISDYQSFAIQCPDDRVVCPHDQTFSSISEFLRYFEDKRRNA